MIAEDYWILQDNTFVATFPKELGPQLKASIDTARNFHSSATLDKIHNGILRKWSGQVHKKRFGL